jgi:hypothetical protein
MSLEKNLARLWRSTALSSAVLCACACNTTTLSGRPHSGVAEMQGREKPARFSFPPPAETHYVWTARRTFDAAIVGTTLADHDVSQLQWNVSTRPTPGDTTTIEKRLVRATVMHNGRSVIDGAPGVGIELVVDAGGNIQDVSGLDEASRTLRALAAPGMQAWADGMFSPQSLRTLIVSRHDLFVGDVIGRPTAPGTTWLVTHRPGSAALLRRYTVEGNQACDGTMCSRLRVHIDLDPRVYDEVAQRLVAGYVRSQGLDASKLSTRSTMASTMRGTQLVQPATMQTYGATMRDAARIEVAAPGRNYEVDVRGTTQDAFQYGPPPLLPIGSL